MVSLFLLLGCNLSYIVDLFAALHELASARARTLLKLASSVRALLKPYGDTLRRIYRRKYVNSRIDHFLPECIAFNQSALRHFLPEFITPRAHEQHKDATLSGRRPFWRGFQ